MDRIIAILATFIAVTAVPGGLALAVDVQTFAQVWLQGTVFDSYTVPGLLLAGPVGGSAAAAAILGFRRHRAAGVWAIAAGAAMTSYVVAALLILNDGTVWPHAMEWLYLILGLLLALAGLGQVRGLGVAYEVVFEVDD